MKKLNILYHKDHAELVLNPKIYPLETVFSAAYILTDRAYIVVDGDPQTSLVVRIMPKKGSIADAAMSFNDELLNYSVYRHMAGKNRGLREEMLKRAVSTNTDDDYVEDRDEILVPWEEKYGR